MNKYITILTIFLLFFSCKKEDIAGCTDSTALNYNASANLDDGSCNYPSLADVNIYFTQTVDGNPLVSNQMIYTNHTGENYSVQTLRYLISNITLHTKNGSDILIDEVHFIDISIDSTLSLSIPAITDQNYTTISFTMGLDSNKNITNLFLNESFYPSFSWPEFLGGGYHYMQLEGDFNSVFNGYATHTGGTNGVDYSFSKEFPITINSKSNIYDIYINMEISNWYENPHTLNFTTNGIMDDANSQIILKDNGIEDVFSVYTLDASN